MKIFGKCRGCERRKLINLMRLCKRCNKEVHKYISKSEMESILREHATFAKEKKEASAKKAKEEETAAPAEGEETESEGQEKASAKA